jgi:SEC-C motif-containing protein
MSARTPSFECPAHADGSIVRRMNVPFQDTAALEAYCQPFLEQRTRPQTAADLMASRYVAYSKSAIDYLFATHDPKTRAQADRKAIETWAKNAAWQGLEIVSTERGGVEDNDGTVEFIARYELDGKQHEHHELATFRRIDGQWFFVDGAFVGRQPVRRDEAKQSRNELCRCGSGKKYKKCCGSVAAQ